MEQADIFKKHRPGDGLARSGVRFDQSAWVSLVLWQSLGEREAVMGKMEKS